MWTERTLFLCETFVGAKMIHGVKHLEALLFLALRVLFHGSWITGDTAKYPQKADVFFEVTLMGFLGGAVFPRLYLSLRRQSQEALDQTRSSKL